MSSNAFDIKSNFQVGRGHRDIETKFRALMWQGSAQSMIDLHPDNFFDHTEAYGINETGSIQVGFGSGELTNSVPNALMWSGSASSYLSLHNSNWEMSIARDVSGNDMVGEVWITNSVRGNAILWQNAGTTIVNLHPSHTIFSSASWGNAIRGGIQVGGASNINGDVNAFLWHGTSQSAVNLIEYRVCLNEGRWSSSALLIVASQIFIVWETFHRETCTLWKFCLSAGYRNRNKLQITLSLCSCLQEHLQDRSCNALHLQYVFQEHQRSLQSIHPCYAG